MHIRYKGHILLGMLKFYKSVDRYMTCSNTVVCKRPCQRTQNVELFKNICCKRATQHKFAKQIDEWWWLSINVKSYTKVHKQLKKQTRSKTYKKQILPNSWTISNDSYIQFSMKSVSLIKSRPKIRHLIQNIDRAFSTEYWSFLTQLNIKTPAISNWVGRDKMNPIEAISRTKRGIKLIIWTSIGFLLQSKPL